MKWFLPSGQRPAFHDCNCRYPECKFLQHAVEPKFLCDGSAACEAAAVSHPRHWSLFELCGHQISCNMLDPLSFASAEPIRKVLKKDQEALDGKGHSIIVEASASPPMPLRIMQRAMGSA